MRTFTFLSFFLASTGLYAQCTQPVWADEFDGSSLDQSKWAFETGTGCPDNCGGWGNSELEYYTPGNNLSVSNGILTLRAIKETQKQTYNNTTYTASFTSSRLVTKGKASWKYGRMEARMRMPLGRGLWPAFWMLSVDNQWPMTGEIDIMEYRGDKSTQTNSTLHYGSAWPNNQYDAASLDTKQTLSSDFHLYSVEWTESELRFYFDGTLINKETKSPNSLNPASNGNPWPWTSEFYIILNLAVGGNYTGNPPVNEVQMTKPTFEIDYVRVYELPCVRTGLENEQQTQQNIQIYPQPFEDQLRIESPYLNEISSIELRDAQGISLARVQQKNGIVSLPELSKGIYFLLMQVGDKQVVRRVLKQ